MTLRAWRARPTFSCVSPVGTEELLARFSEHLASSQSYCEGLVFRSHVVLRPPESVRHIWSPVLHVRIEDNAGEGVDEDVEQEENLVLGRFAPDPNVWTAFMACYGVLCMVALGGLVWGFAQYVLGETPWALVLIAAAAFMAAFVYGAVFIGQGLSSEQMYEMRSFVDRVLRDDSRND